MNRLAIIALLIFAGCGDDKGSTTPIISTPPDVSHPDSGDGDTLTDDDTGDTGDTDIDMANGGMCESVTCELDEKCVKGDCVPASAKLACDEITDLGTLDIAVSKSFSGDTTDFVDTFNSSCGEESTFTGAENAFKFMLTADALVTIELSSSAAVDWLVDVRKDGCEAASGSLLCSGSETLTFQGRAGETYYLVVEPEVGIDKGAFDITMSFEALICDPSTPECDGDALLTCFGGTMQTPHECAAGCTQTACDGENCQAPLEVSAPMSFMGDINGYTNTIDFAGISSCSTNGNGVATPGQDIILHVTGLTANQIVTLDASMDSQDDVIAVLSDCGAAPTCQAFVDLGDVLTWTVPADGDYFVAVDRRTKENGPFAFSLSIE